jgi:hypothetical protein
MSLTALYAFLASIEPGTVASLAGYLVSLAGCLGLKSLLTTGLKCYMEGNTAKDLQRLLNEGQRIKTDGEVTVAREKNLSEEKQLRMKHKHEKEMAQLAARTREAQLMALAA